MFGIGFTELIILSVIVIVLIGPDQLPTVLKTISKMMKELTKARDDFRETVNEDDELKAMKHSLDEVKKTIDDKTHLVKSQVEDQIRKVVEEHPTRKEDDSAKPTEKKNND